MTASSHIARTASARRSFASRWSRRRSAADQTQIDPAASREQVRERDRSHEIGQRNGGEVSIVEALTPGGSALQRGVRRPPWRQPALKQCNRVETRPGGCGGAPPRPQPSRAARLARVTGRPSSGRDTAAARGGFLPRRAGRRLPVPGTQPVVCPRKAGPSIRGAPGRERRQQARGHSRTRDVSGSARAAATPPPGPARLTRENAPYVHPFGSTHVTRAPGASNEIPRAQLLTERVGRGCHGGREFNRDEETHGTRHAIGPARRRRRPGVRRALPIGSPSSIRRTMSSAACDAWNFTCSRSPDEPEHVRPGGPAP